MDRRARAQLTARLIVAALVVSAAAHLADQERDWARTALADLEFIDSTLLENHPAFVDRGPIAGRYVKWRATGLPLARARAGKAHSYAGYFFALSSYVVGFQDNHLYALQRDERLSYRWPGFLTTYSEGSFHAVDVGPAVRKLGITDGDRLTGCDGKSVETLATERVQAFVGQWSLPARRTTLAPHLLVDEGNPFAPPPRQCTFHIGQRDVRVALTYVPIGFLDLRTRMIKASARVEQPPAIRQFAPNAYWMSIPSFASGNPRRAEGLRTLLSRIEASAAQLRDSRLLVFDVRGNGGGVSAFGERIAALIWGEAEVRRKAPVAHAVDWRATRDNLKHFDEIVLPRFKAQLGEQDRVYLAFARVAEGMRTEIARDGVFYRQDEADFYPPIADARPPMPVRAAVFVVADGGCASACLDFIDLLKALAPVTLVGTETSADAIYIDNRNVDLPSRLGSLGVSMKVYRDRARGHNQSHQPDIRWTGGINDTVGLEQRIAKLAH